METRHTIVNRKVDKDMVDESVKMKIYKSRLKDKLPDSLIRICETARELEELRIKYGITFDMEGLDEEYILLAHTPEGLETLENKYKDRVPDMLIPVSNSPEELKATITKMCKGMEKTR